MLTTPDRSLDRAATPAPWTAADRHRREHVQRQRLRTRGVAHRREYQKLIAAEPADRVLGPHRALQRGTDGHQQRIARMMAEAVVHRLEAVEVDEEQRHRHPRRIDECSLDAGHHRAPAQHVGERIAFDAVPELLLRHRQLMDVDRHGVHAHHRTGGVEVGHVARARPAWALRQRIDDACVLCRRASQRPLEVGSCSAQRRAPRTSPMFLPSRLAAVCRVTSV